MEREGVRKERRDERTLPETVDCGEQNSTNRDIKSIVSGFYCYEANHYHSSSFNENNVNGAILCD